jgi:hypothetical protein
MNSLPLIFSSCLFFLLSVSFAGAQDISREELQRKYEQETIYRLRTNTIIKNNKEIRTGFLGRKIKDEFEISPEGMRAFQMYQQNTKNGLIMFGFSYAALVGSLFILDHNPGLSLAMFGGGALLSAGSVIYTMRGDRFLNKAIWKRNKDVLLK